MQNQQPTQTEISKEWSLFGFVNSKLRRGFVTAVLALSLSGNIYFIWNDNRKEDIYRKVFIKMIEKQSQTDARNDSLKTH